MDSRDKERAKAIIVEIIRQAGGRLYDKTNLFKAFWRAHVLYAREHHRDLSQWPIVRMPQGPGIDKFNVLLGELLTEGVVEAEQVEYEGSGRSGFVFHLLNESSQGLPDPEAVECVRIATKAVDGRTSTSVSDESHIESRAWNAARDGQELDITLDAIPEDEYQRLKAKFASRRQEFEAAISSARD